jgi:hypothetical protein
MRSQHGASCVACGRVESVAQLGGHLQRPDHHPSQEDNPWRVDPANELRDLCGSSPIAKDCSARRYCFDGLQHRPGVVNYRAYRLLRGADHDAAVHKLFAVIDGPAAQSDDARGVRYFLASQRATTCQREQQGEPRASASRHLRPKSCSEGCSRESLQPATNSHGGAREQQMFNKGCPTNPEHHNHPPALDFCALLV